MLLQHGEDCMTCKVAVCLDALHAMPPFHAKHYDQQKAKKQAANQNKRPTYGVSQSSILRTSSSLGFCSHCVHPAAVCLITSFSRSFSFTSSAPTSSSPTSKQLQKGTAAYLLFGIFTAQTSGISTKNCKQLIFGVNISCKI